MTTGMMIIALILVSAGYLISIYFYLATHNRIPTAVPWLPSLVQIGDCRCEELVDTPFGRTLGRSNAFWAMWYFVFLAIAIISTNLNSWPGVTTLFFITLIAFARSIYLAWALLLMRVVCRPCITAHIINLGLILIFGYLEWPKLFPG
ncbi:MAG: vitamin K epoxide reductase family protein [Fidelibacterota bacterium]